MSRLGQIKQTFKSVRIEIKAFLRRQQWKEALIFFCFILLAFGFWLLQSLQQEYEIDIRIPVKYKNVPPDISFTETPPEAITVKVKDKGSVLLNYSFGRSFAPIEANMKTQSERYRKRNKETSDCDHIPAQLRTPTYRCCLQQTHQEGDTSRIRGSCPNKCRFQSFR